MAKRKKTKAATKTRNAESKALKAKRPDGSISSGIYDAVQKLTANGKMTRTAAFKHIAKESGRKEGTVSVNYYYAAKKRGAKMRPKAKSAPKPAAKGVKALKSGGSVSAMIYDAIEKLMAGGKMKRSVAFRQLAKTSGRNEGTISVNYYYAAKKRGAKMGKRRLGKAAATASRTVAQPRVLSLLKAVEELLRQQAAQLDALRRENDRFVEVKRLVGRL